MDLYLCTFDFGTQGGEKTQLLTKYMISLQNTLFGGHRVTFHKIYSLCMQDFNVIKCCKNLFV